MFKILLITDNS